MIDMIDGPAERIERDRIGRPLVKQPDGTTAAYTRCTTYVGCLEDQYMVQRWRNRMVAIGLADRPDLLLQVAAHRAPEDNWELNRIVDQAAEAGKASAAANIGTALHKLTERVDRGEPVGQVPHGYAADVEAYRGLIERWRIRAHLIEPFTVLDELKVGGTPDRVYEVPGIGYCIGDTKSGSLDFGGLKFAMQMAVYSRSLLYDPRTGGRTPYPVPVSQKWGVVVHLPQGTGTAELFKVDIEQGWEAVQVATTVREWRNRGRKLIQPMQGEQMTLDAAAELERTEAVTRAIGAIHKADSLVKLREIWAYADSLGLNMDELKPVFMTRVAAVEGSQR